VTGGHGEGEGEGEGEGGCAAAGRRCGHRAGVSHV